MDGNGIGGQTALFEVDSAPVRSKGAGGAGARVLCQMCKRPVRTRESADARIGQCCAARLGRAVMAARSSP